jgi:large subunit ribosomal protein L35
MPKMKTNKSIVKRVKVTGTGKIMRYSPGSGHLKSAKSNKTLRSFRKPKPVASGFARHARKMLGIGNKG